MSECVSSLLCHFSPTPCTQPTHYDAGRPSPMLMMPRGSRSRSRSSNPTRNHCRNRDTRTRPCSVAVAHPRLATASLHCVVTRTSALHDDPVVMRRQPLRTSRPCPRLQLQHLCLGATRRPLNPVDAVAGRCQPRRRCENKPPTSCNTFGNDTTPHHAHAPAAEL